MFLLHSSDFSYFCLPLLNLSSVFFEIFKTQSAFVPFHPPLALCSSRLLVPPCNVSQALEAMKLLLRLYIVPLCGKNQDSNEVRCEKELRGEDRRRRSGVARGQGNGARMSMGEVKWDGIRNGNDWQASSRIDSGLGGWRIRWRSRDHRLA